MINNKNKQPDINSIPISSTVFIQYYNENIPGIFPRVTIKTLEKFQTTHPTLFKANNDWIIDKCRKKLMDWLVSNPNIDKK